MNLIDNLKWRYAVKQFDISKKIPDDKMRKIMEAVRLAPSSYGLQLYKVIIIEDEETRKKLKAASWNQSQITDSSALVVFCNYKSINHYHIDEYLNLKCEIEKTKYGDLKGYGDFMKNKLAEMTEEERDSWTKRQTYIALGILLAACAELKIDSCPMEGFEPEKYNEILKLPEQNLNAAVITAIGYRSESDNSQFDPKIRKSINDLFEIKKVEPYKLAI